VPEQALLPHSNSTSVLGCGRRCLSANVQKRGQSVWQVIGSIKRQASLHQCQMLAGQLGLFFLRIKAQL